MTPEETLKPGDKVEIYDIMTPTSVAPGVYEVSRGRHSPHRLVFTSIGRRWFIQSSNWKWKKHEEYDDSWI